MQRVSAASTVPWNSLHSLEEALAERSGVVERLDREDTRSVLSKRNSLMNALSTPRSCCAGQCLLIQRLSVGTGPSERLQSCITPVAAGSWLLPANRSPRVSCLHRTGPQQIAHFPLEAKAGFLARKQRSSR